MEEKQYHDNHYAEMTVQPIEVMQACMSPEAFAGLLYGNAIKYHMRKGHKAGEKISKETDKRDRYISWLYHATRGEIIDPKKDYDYPSWYHSDTITLIERKVNELAMAKKYSEKK